MKKSKNKISLGVIGVILTLFGVIGSIPILINKQFLGGLIVTALSVIIGIILISIAFDN